MNISNLCLNSQDSNLRSSTNFDKSDVKDSWSLFKSLLFLKVQLVHNLRESG